jgi:hypothetical protein
MININRVSLYADDGRVEARQCWKEIAACRYQLMANEIMRWNVPPSEGHDDFVTSLALCARAADLSFPPAASGLLSAEVPTDEISRW